MNSIALIKSLVQRWGEGVMNSIALIKSLVQRWGEGVMKIKASIYQMPGFRQIFHTGFKT